MVNINSIKIGRGYPLAVIAGPCVVENEEMIMHTAGKLKSIAGRLNIPLIFKSSYRKANRTAVSGFTGLDFTKALNILQKVKEQFELPLLTDVHSEIEVPVVAEVADALQIPAFLCRQTDLLLAVGYTGRAVNIKKGQFLAPEDMARAAEKVAGTGNTNVLLTERGTSFGYRNLVVDMRGLQIMRQSGYPVVYDTTHSVQIPGGMGTASGGQPEFILPLARAALATGAVSAVFIETHPDPPNALSDAASQLPLDQFESFVKQLKEIYALVSGWEAK